MRLSPRLIALLLIACNIGCASVGVRTGAYSERAAIYPATAIDAGIVSYVVIRPFIPYVDPTFSPDAQEGLVYLFAPVSIIDLPLAVALDTLLLPYDIYRLRNKQAEEDSRVEIGWDGHDWKHDRYPQAALP